MRGPARTQSDHTLADPGISIKMEWQQALQSD